MEEYLNTLLEQIRCKKARDLVGQEIKGHLEEQIVENKANGMSEKEAVDEAVKDMGDPVEAGVMLDRVHRPQMAWDMVVVMAIISLISTGIHIVIGQKIELWNSSSEYTINGVSGYSMAVHVLIGFIVMLIVYRIDYSFMAKYAKIIGGVFLGVVFLHIFFFGIPYNGAMAFINVPGFGSISLLYLMFLFVPIYGAILYQYYDTGRKGIIKSIIWMLVSSWLAMRIPCLSFALLLFFMMAVLLSIAVWNGWFGISRRKFLTVFWSVMAVLPVFSLALGVGMRWLADYQIERIRAFLVHETSANNYIAVLLEEYFAHSRLFGASGKEIIGSLPEFNSSYILVYLSNYYGSAAALLVCVILAFITYKVFRISFRQKNQLGMIMGCGCGIVFFTNMVVNILESTGFFPTTQTFLPFFSYGGTSIVVSYALIGLVLSIYRYKNILPAHVSRKRDIAALVRQAIK